MHEVDRHQHAFELGERRTDRDVLLAEFFQGHPTQFQQAVHFGYGVAAVVPEVGLGLAAALGAGVGVADIA